MTEEELAVSFGALKSDVKDLTSELRGLVELEKKRHEDDVLQRRRHEDSDNRRIEAELQDWNNKQKFLSKHGGKIVSVLFSGVVAGLAWYGAGIRSELKAEQRAKNVDAAIKTNTDDLGEFKESTEADLEVLQNDSIDKTIMMDEGFKRIDDILLKGFKKKLKKEDLPDRPLIDAAANEAKCIKEARGKGFKDSVIEKCRTDNRQE